MPEREGLETIRELLTVDPPVKIIVMSSTRTISSTRSAHIHQGEVRRMTLLQRILLVEDSMRDAELACDALAEHHLANELIHVRDGAEALDYLYRRGEFAARASGEPAVVLLDLKMPKVNGLEVLRAIKGDPHLKLIPVVMMTSSREEGDLLRSYELGVNAYVVKPMNFHDLVEAVKQVGAFWAVINEPPPGSLRRDKSVGRG
jgi:CheY-like chemotaxis protein